MSRALADINTRNRVDCAMLYEARVEQMKLSGSWKQAVGRGAAVARGGVAAGTVAPPISLRRHPPTPTRGADQLVDALQAWQVPLPGPGHESVAPVFEPLALVQRPPWGRTDHQATQGRVCAGKRPHPALLCQRDLLPSPPARVQPRKLVQAIVPAPPNTKRRPCRPSDTRSCSCWPSSGGWGTGPAWRCRRAGPGELRGGMPFITSICSDGDRPLFDAGFRLKPPESGAVIISSAIAQAVRLRATPSPDRREGVPVEERFVGPVGSLADHGAPAWHPVPIGRRPKGRESPKWSRISRTTAGHSIQETHLVHLPNEARPRGPSADWETSTRSASRKSATRPEAVGDERIDEQPSAVSRFESQALRRRDTCGDSRHHCLSYRPCCGPPPPSAPRRDFARQKDIRLGRKVAI